MIDEIIQYVQSQLERAEATELQFSAEYQKHSELADASKEAMVLARGATVALTRQLQYLESLKQPKKDAPGPNKPEGPLAVKLGHGENGAVEKAPD